jgi:hypothetical protein
MPGCWIYHKPWCNFYCFACLQAIRTGWVHPNINLDNPEKNVVILFLTENFPFLNVESVLTLFFITKFNMCWTISIWNGGARLLWFSWGLLVSMKLKMKRTNPVNLWCCGSLNQFMFNFRKRVFNSIALFIKASLQSWDINLFD